MTVVLVLMVIACVAWVVVTLLSRRGAGDPLQTVDGFTRALHALAPDDGDKPRRRGWRRERR